MFKKLKSIYNSEDFRKNISTIIFWGSMWGIIESTAGYLLHRMNLKVGWCIWFPIAFYFLDKIYRRTGEAKYMIYGAFITSAIKLTNLFIEVRIDKVINPAMSIILEAGALFILYEILERKNRNLDIIWVAGVNILWRSFYIIYLLLAPKSFLAISPLRGTEPLLKFMLLESLANTVIITSYIVLRNRLSEKFIKEKIKGFNISPIPSLLILAFAVVLQLVI